MLLLHSVMELLPVAARIPSVLTRATVMPTLQSQVQYLPQAIAIPGLGRAGMRVQLSVQL